MCIRDRLATVVTLDGDIDASNVQQVMQYATRYVLAEKPFVLDLSVVNSISPQGISLIFAIDDKCDAAGLEWELVANPEIIATIGCDVDLSLIHISEPTRLLSISYAVFCLKKKKKHEKNKKKKKKKTRKKQKKINKKKKKK